MILKILALFLFPVLAVAQQPPVCELSQSESGNFRMQLPQRDGAYYKISSSILNWERLQDFILDEQELADIRAGRQIEIAAEQKEQQEKAKKGPGVIKKIKDKLLGLSPVPISAGGSVNEDSPFKGEPLFHIIESETQIVYQEENSEALELNSGDLEFFFSPVAYEIFIRHFDNEFGISDSNIDPEALYLFGAFNYSGPLGPERWVSHGRIFGCQVKIGDFQ